ncbi:hypothetical protein DFJ73DRAFT_800683 [Zopfochytrium polystomum]|nr:hypothetical protein DFJ73DRAFT_800683 [Zopfochytrium polystomum]
MPFAIPFDMSPSPPQPPPPAADPTPTAVRTLLGLPEPHANSREELLFNDLWTCDVIIRLLPSRRPFFLHKNVLMLSSDYFKTMWESEFAEASSGFLELLRF